MTDAGDNEGEQDHAVYWPWDVAVGRLVEAAKAVDAIARSLLDLPEDQVSVPLHLAVVEASELLSTALTVLDDAQ